jgi:hypothetical protein
MLQFRFDPTGVSQTCFVRVSQAEYKIDRMLSRERDGNAGANAWVVELTRSSMPRGFTVLLYPWGEGTKGQAPTLLSPEWLRPFGLSRDPAFRGVRIAVESLNIGLYIEKRGVVEDVDARNLEGPPVST